MEYYDPSDIMRIGPIRPLDPELVNTIKFIKEQGEDFYNVLAGQAPSADMTLAKRKVEEAVMWAVKALTA